ncbi:MAG: ASPIC/UnbV domain-containing protein, partial [Planctomycetota bacterium]
LNMGDGQFATVSSVSGLDFDDDARSPARIDWDFDGDLDLWIGNRTAPQLRLMRNDTQTGNHFLALHLTGTTCNRDAIGARVEVVLKGEESKPLVKTLMAGDGFLSQSTKWLHFGLGKSDQIESVTVRWPGGDAQVLAGIECDRWYRVQQDDSPEQIERKPIRMAASSESLATAASGSASRIVTSSRNPLPPLRYEEFGGRTVDIPLGRKQPVLLNLWASWCQPCLKEMSEWKEHAGKFQSAGLQVYCLSMDEVDQNDTSSKADSRKLIEKLDLPFNVGVVNRELYQRLEQSLNWPFRRRIPVAVPTSLLIDGNGRLTVIYRGPVSSDQIVEDVALCSASNLALADTALPFPGRWHVRPQPARPMATGIRLMQEGDVADAAEFIRRNYQLLNPHKEFPLLSVWVGEKLIGAGEIQEAKEFLRLAAQSNTKNLTVLNNLAWQYSASPHQQLRNSNQALKLASIANRLSGEQNEHILATLAVAQASAGRFEQAIKTATLAAALAKRSGNVELEKKQQERIKLFRENKPYRDPATDG